MVGRSFVLGLLGLGATVLAAPTPTKTTPLDDRALVVGSGTSTPSGCIAIVWEQVGICILSPPTTTIFASTKREARTTTSSDEEVKRNTTPAPPGCLAVVWEYASICIVAPATTTIFPSTKRDEVETLSTRGKTHPPPPPPPPPPTSEYPTPPGCVEVVFGDAIICLFPPTSTIHPSSKRARGASAAAPVAAEAEVVARNTTPAPSGCLPVVWEYASICILAPPTTTIFPSTKKTREVYPGKPWSGPIIPAKPYPGGPIVPDRPYPGGPIVPDRPYPGGPIVPDKPYPGGPFIPGR